MEKIKIVALFGKSGAGKDTIQRQIMDKVNGVKGIVSCTTRPPRDNETDGIDYHFLSNMEFTQKVLNGSMLEATEFRDWFYGTSIDELDTEKINVGVFNIAGIEALLEDSRLEVIPVLVYAEDRIRLYRALMRERDPDCEEICRRFFADQKDFESIDFNYLIWENNGEASPLAVSDMTWFKQWSKIMEAFGQNPLD